MPHGTVPVCSKHRTGTARHSHCGGSYPSFHPLSWGNEVGFSLSANKANAKPDCSDGGATLFLAGADHGYCEKEKRTRQNNLQSATVSLQVVIGLCKRKETAALKIKAAVSNGRVKLSALRRLFFFCRRPADYFFMSKGEKSIVIIKLWSCISIIGFVQFIISNSFFTM